MNVDPLSSLASKAPAPEKGILSNLLYTFIDFID